MGQGKIPHRVGFQSFLINFCFSIIGFQSLARASNLSFAIQNNSVTTSMLANNYLGLLGGSLTGDLNMNSCAVTNASSVTANVLNLFNNPSETITYASSDSTAGTLTFQKARGSAVAETAFAAADTLGSFVFQGEIAGVGPPGSWQTGALIQAQADSSTLTTASGNLSFQVRHDGDAAPTERLRINSTGIVTVNGSIAGSAGTLTLGGNLMVPGVWGAASPTAVSRYPGVSSPDSGFVDWGDGSGWRLNFTGNKKKRMIASFYDTGGVVLGSSVSGNTTVLSIYGSGLAAGQYCSYGSVAGGGASCSSDIRLKNRLRNLTGALEKLSQIQGIYFKWKHPATQVDRVHLGLMAQDVQKVFPELITVEKESEHYLQLDYAGLVVPLIEAVKELQSKLTQQDKKLKDQGELLQERLKEIADLKFRVDALEVKLNAKLKSKGVSASLGGVFQKAAALLLRTTDSLFIANVDAAASTNFTFSLLNNSVTDSMLANTYVQTTGGSLFGDLNMSSTNILNVSALSASTLNLVNQPSELMTYVSTDSTAGSLIFQKAQGSAALETQFNASDTLGSILFQGEYGGTGPPGTWQTGAMIQAQADSTASSTASGNLSFQVRHDGDPALTERLRINSTGVVTVTGKIAGSSGTLAVSGNLFAGGVTHYPGLVFPDIGYIDFGDGSGWRLNFTANGKSRSIISFYDSGSVTLGSAVAGNTTDLSIYGSGLAAGQYCSYGAAAAGAISCSSDIRLKNRLGNLVGALAKLKQIQGIYFKWKHPASQEDQMHLGVIAQDVQKVYPDLITVEKEADHYLQLDYAGLVVPVIEGIKELDAQFIHQDGEFKQNEIQLEKKAEELSDLEIRIKTLETQLGSG